MRHKENFSAVVKILSSHMNNAQDRQAFVEGALYGCSVLNLIDWGGSAQTFTVNLVKKLINFECSPGRPAIVMLLEELKGQTGEDRQKHIDALIQASLKAAQPVSATQMQQPQSKSIRECYNDLPSDEDRARFRALGVLAPDVPFDNHILLNLWNVSSSDLEIYIFDLAHYGLLENLEVDLYKQGSESRIQAKKFLKLSPNSERLKYIRRYIDIMNNLAWTPDQVNARYMNKYDWYFEHMIYVIGLAREERENLPPTFVDNSLKDFSRSLYGLGLQWMALKSYEKALKAFEMYEYTSHDLDIGSIWQDAAIYYRMSYCYEKLSTFKDAAQYLQKYINLVEGEQAYPIGCPTVEEAEKQIIELLNRDRKE